MTSRPRVGLLGGTFDPIHNGHLAVARTAIRTLDLDRLLIIPSGTPPHRPDSPRSSGYHRMEMVRRAVDEALAGESIPVEVSDLEQHRTGRSYTDDTLRAFGAKGLTPMQLVFITGTDAFVEIGTWHRYPEVLDGAHFAVLARPGTTLDELQRQLPILASRMTHPDQLDAAATPRIVLVEGDMPNISATDIRARIGRHESIDGLVPASVAAYIAEHGLYASSTAPDTPDAPAHRTAPNTRDARVAPDAPSSPPHGQVTRS